MATMEFTPNYAVQNKDQVIRCLSNHLFDAEDDSSSPRVIEAVVVKLKFAIQTPYQDYYVDLPAGGQHVSKHKFSSERLL